MKSAPELKATDKHCIRCDVLLTVENWKRHCRIGYINKCNDCLRQEKRRWINEWRTAHPGADTKRAREYLIRLKASDPVKARAKAAYDDCRKRAIKTKKDFDLTPAFILSMMREAIVCPYFGWTLTHKAGKAKTLASIDRVDSTKGYLQGNVKVISYLANLMKSHATESELIAFADGIRRVHIPQSAFRTAEKIRGAEGNR